MWIGVLMYVCATMLVPCALCLFLLNVLLPVIVSFTVGTTVGGAE